MEYVTLSENMSFPANRPIPWIANLSDGSLKNYYSIHWNMPWGSQTHPHPPESAD